MTEKTKKPEKPVDENTAKKHALFAIKSNWVMASKGFEGRAESGIEEKPLVINDLSGETLFYEYDVVEGGTAIGAVKASASKKIGSAVPQVQVTPRSWDPDEVKAKTKDLIKKKYGKAKILETDLVCYSYPKIGVRYLIDDPSVGEGSVIFDVGNFAQVEALGSDTAEGFTAWSFYQQVPEGEISLREKRWNQQNEEMENAAAEMPALLKNKEKVNDRQLLKKGLVDRMQKDAGPVIKPGDKIIKPYSQQVIQFGPHCPTHNCWRLLAQETNVYCAVATGQMILDFYRYYFTQAQIATAMGTGAGGSSNEGQAAGYQSLSNKCLVATIDLTADWTEAKAEIGLNRPLKSGIPGHARACFGWKCANIWIAGKPQPRWLYILDPWPWNADACKGGAEYWEDWYAVNHTNFIYVRHRTTACT